MRPPKKRQRYKSDNHLHLDKIHAFAAFVFIVDEKINDKKL